MEPSVKHIALEVRDAGQTAETEIELAVEEPLEIRVNGEPYAVVMRTPGGEMELAAGFCLTEGIVDSFSEILTIGFCADAEGTQNIVNVMTASVSGAGGAAADPRKTSGRRLESRSSCGLCGVSMLEDINKKLIPPASGPRVRAKDLVKMQYVMAERQELQSRTKCAHAAALVRANGDPVVVREDIGRHNALDKAIGFALLNGLDCSDCIAMLSGRISFEMAQKAIRARIPIVAAVSAATALAAELAERLNCTLIGRLRGENMMIYTHPERIIF